MDLSKYIFLIKKTVPRPLRERLTTARLSALARFYELSGGLEYLRRPRVQFLYLHDVAQHDATAFRKLLEKLGREHTYISYSEAVRRVLTGEIDKPYLSLSFDDGLKSCWHAAQALHEMDISGCFFVCPTLLGETDAQKVAAFCADKLHRPPSEFLSWDDVAAMLRQGHEIGSHAITHSVMADLPAAQLADEINDSRRLLQQKVGLVRHFAWPYGRFFHFSAQAARLVFAAGFETCASAESGCHIAAPEHRHNLCVRRNLILTHWPARHIDYLLARNSQRATADNNLWPAGWRATVGRPAALSSTT